MATPIGHALAGYGTYLARKGVVREDQRTLLGFSILLAIAPDFDFLPGLLVGHPALYHQGISHSLAAGLVVSLGISAVYSLRRGTFWADWPLFFFAYASHLLLDLFGPDSRPPIGEPLFWPLSQSHFLAPLQIFLGVRHTSSTMAATKTWLSTVLQPYNLWAISVEALILLPVVLLARQIRRARNSDRSALPTQGIER